MKRTTLFAAIIMIALTLSVFCFAQSGADVNLDDSAITTVITDPDAQVTPAAIPTTNADDQAATTKPVTKPTPVVIPTPRPKQKTRSSIHIGGTLILGRNPGAIITISKDSSKRDDGYYNDDPYYRDDSYGNCSRNSSEIVIVAGVNSRQNTYGRSGGYYDDAPPPARTISGRYAGNYGNYGTTSNGYRQNKRGGSSYDSAPPPPARTMSGGYPGSYATNGYRQNNGGNRGRNGSYYDDAPPPARLQ